MPPEGGSVSELASVPTLRDPVLVAAFEGWNDAGEAASGAVAHLCEVWDATPITELDPENYHDFQVNRPLTRPPPPCRPPPGPPAGTSPGRPPGCCGPGRRARPATSSSSGASSRR